MLIKLQKYKCIIKSKLSKLEQYNSVYQYNTFIYAAQLLITKNFRYEHLHLSVKYNDEFINPNTLLDFIKETRDKAIADCSSHAAHNQTVDCHSAESYP